MRILVTLWARMYGEEARLPQVAMLEGVEKIPEVGLLRRGEVHLEASVVEVHQLRKRAGRAAVEVGSAGGKAAQARHLQPVDVGAEAGGKTLAGVGRGVDDGIPIHIFATADLIDRQIGRGELGEAGNDGRVALVGRDASGSDVHR